MADAGGISTRVLDSLVSAGLLTVEQLASVGEAAAERGVHAGVILSERGLVSAADVASALEHELGVPRVDLTSYAPEDDALALVPADAARSRRALPLFEIEGMLTVAIGDPMDVFALDALAAELALEVEPVLADTDSVAEALAQYYGEAEAPAVPEPDEPVGEAGVAETLSDEADEPVVEASDFFEAPVEVEPAVPVAPSAEPEPDAAPAVPAETIESMAEAVPESAPAVDLDVLAVADARKVAVLVADILEDAVRKGASRIHLLPYKDDFFLVYRVKGALEKAASAPRSLQSALVDGFKAYAKLSDVPATLPALGRVHTKIADRDLVLTCSVVPTIAGQRLVVSFVPYRPEPRSLADLGMTEAEVRALHAMVERGRGILLIAAPVAGGRSSTYYALLHHASQAGKTVYSVERAVEYELPSVAQVLVNPGSPVPVANYVAAGLRQDTDVVAVDGLQTVEDVHLAVEAAGLGRLVIATFPAADIASAVRRMLDLGVEPHSLASALTLGVGQRLVRLNCPNCTQETDAALARTIPGAPKDITDRAGSGCPNCGKSGFRGVTGIFEVLPFTEPVRSTVASSASRADITAAAAKAGMRPLIASGLARVAAGEVSATELDRVLRFSE